MFKRLVAAVQANVPANMLGNDTPDQAFTVLTDQVVRTTQEAQQRAQAVLDEIGEVDSLWCLGDLVGYGADPGAVVDTVKARKLLKDIAEAAWQCADPGVQYDTTINNWHTLPNTSRINASNPCSEYMHVDDSACNLASLNLMVFRSADGSFDVEAYEHAGKWVGVLTTLGFAVAFGAVVPAKELDVVLIATHAPDEPIEAIFEAVRGTDLHLYVTGNPQRLDPAVAARAPSGTGRSWPTRRITAWSA